MKKKVFRTPAAAWLFFIVSTFSLFFLFKTAAAVTGDYNKQVTGTLAASEWNNLLNDFVARSGSRLDGNFSINTATSSGYALDISGIVRASHFSGSIGAADVSTGAFGQNTGGGDFNFLGNIGVGIGTSSPNSIITIANDRWISALNNAGTAYVNLFKVNANDELEIGGALNIGQFQFAEDSGFNTFVDMPVSATPSSGTVEGYTMKVDGDNILTVYSEANGTGGVQNKRVGIGTGTPGFTLDVAGIINASALYVAGSPYIGSQWVTNGTSVYYNTGSVGIGISNPTAKLEVAGGNIFINDATITSGTPKAAITKEYLDSALASTTAGIITQVATSSFWQGSLTGDIYSFNMGDVGIGTTNPSALLHVSASSGAVASQLSVGSVADNIYDSALISLAGRGFLSASGGNSSSWNPTFAYNLAYNKNGFYTPFASTGYGYRGISYGYNEGIKFFASGANTTAGASITPNEVMRVTNAGNVGIGTTNPGRKLAIQTPVGSVNNGLAFLDGAGTEEATFSVDTNTNDLLTASKANLRFYSGSVIGNTVTYPTNERMTILSGGNVGIGTSTPPNKLSVIGNIDIRSGDLRMYNGSSVLSATTDTLLQINSGGFSNVSIPSGNVGIGTTTPGTRLTVIGSGNYSIDAGNYRVGNVAAPVSALDAVNKSYLDSAVSTSQSAFWNLSGSNLFASSTSWNVGIGTTNPATKLDVQGTDATHYLATIYNSATDATAGGLDVGTAQNSTNVLFNARAGGASKFSILGNGNVTMAGNLVVSGTGNSSIAGNVGIGLTNPTYKLDIQDAALRIGETYENTGLRTVNTLKTGEFVVPSYANGKDVVVFRMVTDSAVNTLNFGGGTSVYDSPTAVTFYTGATVTTTGTEKMRIDNLGYVGIGTTTPGTRLTVIGSGNYSIDAGNYRVGNVATPVSALDAVNKSYLDSAVSTSQSAFWNLSGSNLFASSTSWNVGIGTTNPASLLQVGASSRDLQVSSNGLITQTFNDSSGNIKYITLQNAYGNTTVDQAILWKSGDGTTKSNSAQILQGHETSWTSTASTKNSFLSFYTTASNSHTEKLRITSGGNVGIGTTNPSSKLHISGSGVTTMNLETSDIFSTPPSVMINAILKYNSGGATTNMGRIVFAKNNALDADTGAYTAFYKKPHNSTIAEAMRIDPDGNIGIGTTTPGTRLTVIGSGNYSIDAGNYRVGNVATPVAALDAVNKSYLDSAVSTSQSAFWNLSGSNLFASSTSWNVGIGTTTPTRLLTVNGTGANQGFQITSALGTRLNYIGGAGSSGAMAEQGYFELRDNATPEVVFNTSGDSYINTGGNVGIGTTAPGGILEVNSGSAVGNAYFKGNNGSTDARIELASFGGSSGNRRLILNAGEPSIQARVTSSGGVADLLLNPNGGNVGIGTTTPGTRLTVIGSGNYSIDAGNYRVGNVAAPVSALDAVNKSYLDSAVSTSQSAFWNLSGSNLFASSTSWNVGIGTTSPVTNLHVVNSTASNFLGNILKLQATGVDSSAFMQIDRASNYRMAGINYSTAGTVNWFTGTYYNGGTVQTNFGIGSDYQVANQKLVITSAGNVGVGTTSPIVSLDVQTSGNNAITPLTTIPNSFTTMLVGNTGTNGVLAMGQDNAGHAWIQGRSRLGDGSSQPLLLNPLGGNVGIGTTAPISAKLQILSTGSGIVHQNAAAGYFYGTGMTGNDAYLTYYTGAGMTIGYGTVTGGAPTINTLRLLNNGYVGIGTTTPGTRLTVIGSGNYSIDAGNYRVGNVATPVSALDAVNKSYLDSAVSTSQSAFWNLSGSNLFASSTSWNVGIGTTTPGQKLDVVGSIRASANVFAEGALYAGELGTEGRVYFARSSDGSTTGLMGYSGGDLLIQQGGGLASKILMGPSGIQFQTEDSTSPYNKVTRMIIRHGDSGNVGIGTTAPASKLQVSMDGDTATWGGFNFIPASSSSGSSNVIRVGAQDQSASRGLDLAIFDTSDGSSDAQIKLRFDSVDAKGNILFDTSGSERMRIDKDGYIGIGTTSPLTKLHLYNGAGGGSVPAASYDVLTIENNNINYLNLISPVNSRAGIMFSDNTRGQAILGYSHGDTAFSPIDSFYFYSGAVTRMVINNTGNVGIGTTTPAAKLSVSGGNAFINDAVITSGTPKAAITKEYLDSALGVAQTAFWNLSGSNLFASSTSWNIGIGTTAPGAKLDIISPDNTADVNQFRIGMTTSNYGTYTFRQKTTGGYANQYLALDVVNNAGTFLNTMAWSGGNVGIGTTAPGTGLSFGTTKSTISVATSDTADNGTLTLDAGGGGMSSTRGALMLLRGNEVASYGGAVEIQAGNSGTTGTISFNTGAGSRRMTIDSIGNVGIGTASPITPLTISRTLTNDHWDALTISNSGSWSGALGKHANIIFTDSSTVNHEVAAIGATYDNGVGRIDFHSFYNGGYGIDSNIVMSVVGNGNVGIGTTTPATRLTVIGSGNYSIDAGNYRVGNVAAPVSALDAVNKSYLDSAVSTSQSAFWNLSGSNLFASSTSWNVGIGTTTPTSNLHVVGSTNNVPVVTISHTGSNPKGLYVLGGHDSGDYSANFANQSGTSLMYIRGDGNVGIGVTNPGAKLQVNGTTQFNDGTYWGSIGRATYGSTNFYLIGEVGKTISLGANGLTQHLFIDTAGNVGVGTTNPFATLHVNSSNANTYFNGSGLKVGYSNNTEGLAFWENISSGATYIGSLYDNTAGTMNFVTHAASSVNKIVAMTIKDSYVGIGTTNPGGKLDIRSDGATQTTFINLGENTTGFGNNEQSIDFKWWNSTLGNGRISGYTETTAGSGSGGLKFYTAAVGSAYNATPSLTLNAAGNVGIGTTTPGTRLTVIGSGNYSIDAGNYRVGNVATPVSALDAVNKSYLDSAIGVAQSAFWNLNGSNLYASSTSWNVGIGTTAPISKLNINGINSEFTIGDTTTYPGSAIRIGSTRRLNYLDGLISRNLSGVTGADTYQTPHTNTSGGYQGIELKYPGNMAFYAATGATTAGAVVTPSARMFIDGATGNVGIGTTAAGAKLEVNGNIRTTVDNVLPNLVLDSSGAGDNWTSQGAYISVGEQGALGAAALHLTYIGNGYGYVGMGTVTSGVPAQSYLRFFYNSKDIYTDSNLQNAATGNSYFMGNLGIGTTTPATRLTVIGSGNYSIDAGNYRVGNVATPVSALDAVNKSYLDSAIGVAQSAFWNLNGSNLYASSTSWNVGIGTTDPGVYRLKVAGDVAITGTLQTQTGSDFAEEFRVETELEPGTVVVMADSGHKAVTASSQAYDRTVVGIVSDNPSIIAGHIDSEKKAVVAMMGVVSVKVNNSNGKIKKGDLLTTADATGYAMKATDFKPGTLIGKALEDLNTRTGYIKVLVNLQ